jgi:hypothetical protein
MLREAGLSEIAKKAIPKTQCVFVARRRGNDELTPSDQLFRDFDKRKKDLEGKLGKGSSDAHNRAYLECDYESRFRNQVLENREALKKLKEICLRAQKQDIFLVCYEGPSKACHRRILLRLAEERFGAKIAVEGVEPK